MPERGSVQLLLLSLRPRATLGLGLGAAVILLFAGLVLFREGFPLLDKTGIAQALRQSAWQQALAGQPQRWPWEDMSENMSLAPSAKVPRLGLSASVLTRFADTTTQVSPQPPETDHATADQGATGLGDVVLSDVTIGDSITFTAADGETCIYRITGRPVVDPHLAEAEAQRSDGGRLLFNCGPLDRLIMQATQEAQDEPPVVPVPTEHQQKL